MTFRSFRTKVNINFNERKCTTDPVLIELWRGDNNNCTTEYMVFSKNLGEWNNFLRELIEKFFSSIIISQFAITILRKFISSFFKIFIQSAQESRTSEIFIQNVKRTSKNLELADLHPKCKKSSKNLELRRSSSKV